MNTTITIQTLVEVGLAFMGLWGFFKVVNEVIKSITARHDKEQKWDKYEENLKEVEKKINDNHADTEAKIKDIRDELYIQSECMLAVLEGLQQQGCNGPVSEAKKKMDAHLLERAYDK